MKKTEKISVLISIVLISLIAIGAVSAADDTAAADDADLAAVDEVQAIDDTNTNDDIDYESNDIIVTDTGDSGDDDAISADATKTTNTLGATQLTAGDTLSFTNLSDKVSAGGFIQIKDNYVYNPTTDSRFVDGVTITKDTTLMGNNGLYKIDGSNAARLFKIADGATLTLIGLTLTGGHATQGGAVYVDNGQLAISDSKFTGNSADYGGAVYAAANGQVIGEGTFTENAATYRGGAIYSEGNVDLSDSVIDSNDITYRENGAVDLNGGAAIYNNGGTLTLTGVQVTKNPVSIIPRDGNDGDKIHAAIVTRGAATITDCNISDNKGSWGGGVYVCDGATLNIKDSVFEENTATFGAAVYVEEAKAIIDNCDFIKNHCEGTGSPGTSNTQAGAVLIMAEGASASITNSNFEQNSATTGGAVSVSQATGDVLIDNCEFTANTAAYEGGAIYNYAADGATVTVSNSKFQDNTATTWGDAISNDAALKLEGNTITGGRPAAIGNFFGTIDSATNVNILDGETVTTTSATNEITATITDDKGNLILDRNLVLLVDGNEVTTARDKANGVMIGTYTFTNPGTYEVTAKGYDADHTTAGTLIFQSSLMSLKELIDAAADGDTIDLTYGYAYIDDLDNTLKETGIVVDKNIILNGNGVTIDGADVSRLFKVTNGATLTLNDVVVANGFAADGACVYVDNGAKLTATGSTFKDSVATYSGGAIYALGEVSLTNCIVDNNDITDRSKNNNTGGAAIFLNNTSLTLVNTQITNNGKDFKYSTEYGNARDLLSGVVQLIDSDATISGSLFENNAACYGGAINIINTGGTVENLKVTDSRFINNKAYDGAGINIEQATFEIAGCTFTNNQAIGVGSPDYASAGGGIAFSKDLSSGTVTDSTFTGNSATWGGAIYSNPRDTAHSVIIDGCTFTDNTASEKGGGVFFNGYNLTVSNSAFTGNTAPLGESIYNGGYVLYLTKNTIDNSITCNGDVALSENTIGGYINLGKDTTELLSNVIFTINDNATYNLVAYDDFTVKVKVTDDNGNIIRTYNDKIGIQVWNNANIKTLTFNEQTGLYEATGEITQSGKIEMGNLNVNFPYVDSTLVTQHTAYLNVSLANRIVEVTYENVTYPSNVVVTVKVTLEKDGRPLQYNTVKVTIDGVTKSVSTNSAGISTFTFEGLVGGSYVMNVSMAKTAKYNPVEQLYDLVVFDKQGTYKDLQYRIEHAVDGIVNLPYDFAYDADYDGAALAEGIAISSDVTLVAADGTTISGNELARVFKVTNGATLTLNGVTITKGAADEGAGVYVENGATLVATGATFVDNTAVTRGGAIYSEGTVDLKDSTLKENYIDNRGGAGDENKGGAALFNKGGIATLDNVQVIDNVKDYENGDVLDGAIVAMGKTTITNSNFKGNKGRYGGAITATETDETLTVKGTTFEENLAIFGGAIYDSGVPLVVEDCTFIKNSGVGPGSAGTSSSQGGAILVMGETSSAEITGSTFTENSADLGGAVAISSGTSGTFTIGDCTFTENTATSGGGAIYGYTTDSTITVKDSEFNKNDAPYGGAISASSGTDLAVSGSEFTENTATYGGAILAGGDTTVSGSTFTDNSASAAYYSSAIHAFGTGNTLALSGNTIGSDERAQVYTQSGVSITSPLKVRILDNETVRIHMAPYDVTAVVTDDMGNKVVNLNFRFKVDGTEVQGISISAATGVYKATFTPTETGEFVVSTNLADAANVETGTLIISRSLTDLANIIAAAEEGATITLDGDYSYIDAFDSALVNGIVIDKNITIKGAENANIINGSDFARLFKVIDGNTLTLDGVTIANGKADDGAGIYVDSGAKLVATGSTFKDNTATYSGGAIYADNAQITLTDCVLDGNDATDVASNNDTGGAAIYGNSATIALVNTNVTNNGNKELDRTKGDLINGVINLMNSDATVTGCVFENNTGIYGGAITTQAPAGAKTLTISESNFTANAAYTGGAVYVGPNVNFNIKDSTFDANNKATGEGSPGYTSGGGAIQIIGAQGTIDNVTIKNSIATQGGAIGIEGTAPVTIKDSTFESNTATSEGGAIYAFNYTDVTVTGCTFTNNDAPFGSAISNDGTLSLSGNTITGGSVVPIANYYGTITSPVYVTTLDGQTVTTATATNDITAVLKDDKGNAIIDKKLVLIVNGEDVTTSYNKVTGIMTGSYTFTQPGTYEVTAKDIDAEHTTAGKFVFTAGTFTELVNLIAAAEAGSTITLDHDITYDATFDGDALKEGIAITKSVTIVGADGIEICGNDLARVFKVSDGAALTLKDITICDGAAEKGAGVFVESGASLVADNVTFTENVAVKRGGAVYSEGTVNIANSRIDKNNVTFRTENNDNGGAAIYNLGGTLTVTDTNITDNQNDIVPREGNSGDYINSAIITTGDASFTGCNISKNSGSWGGGIYVTNDATLTVKDSVFEENYATFGAAIYDENAKVIIDNCNFTDNHCGGVGSPGTSNTQAGAVLIMGNGASATITNSKFEKNSAKVGGAVSISQATGDVLIEKCNFTENTATDEGGAIYNYAANGATVTVKDSIFKDNTATNWGDAISNDASLKLDKNTITGGRDAAIGNWLGTIDSKVVSRILENTTYNWHTSEFLINATLTDDNGNKINDKFFKFIITYTAFRGTIEVPATYYSDLGYYQGKFTPDKAGEYLINLGYENEEVATSVITVHKSLIDLANLIANDEDGIIDLDDDYAYIAEFDSSIINGIVIDKAVTINGAENANIINGSNLARLFKVTAGNTLTLNGVTIANAKADKGAGVYVDAGATLNANNVNFTENSAVYRGGAIYSEGTVNVDTAVFDKNDITFRTANDDNGGAAIYNLNGVLNVNHANITNSVKDIVIRDGNAGDLLVGVVVTTGETLIQNSYFANNTGSWGGAISSLGYMNNEAYTLTVENTTFEGNNATFGGAIFVESSNLVVKDSRFNNNLGVGVGSSGTSNTQGGAIVVHPAGSSATITGSNFTANSANVGGAVSLAGVDKNSLIDNCIFTDNTATSEGGAVYLWTQGDAVATVKDSKFSGNTAPWGNAISNDGTLTLSGNTVSTTSADIANYYGSIVSPISVSILGNDTTEGSGIVTAALGETVTITGVITDDNGNLIRDINFDYKVTNGNNVKDIHATYNADTNKYEAQYVIENAGDHLVTIISDANTNLIINTGLYQVEKAKATLTVTVANIKKGEKAKVEVELLGVDDTGLAGQPITVRVNDVDYEITTGDDGKYSFEIDGLDVGRYDAVAVFAGNNNYKLEFDSTIFDVKEEPALTVSIDNIAYGEDAVVEVTLKVGDTPITGFVDVTIGEETYKVAVIDGEGTLEVSGLAVGTYTYTAAFAETADYFAAGPTDEQTFTVSATDVVIDIGTPWVEVGEDGFSFVHMNIAVYDDQGNLLELDEEEGPWSEEVITPVTLVIKDKEGTELFRIEHAVPNEDSVIELAGTKDLAVGDYLITAIIEDAGYNLVGKDTFEFMVVKKGLSVQIDGEEEISVGDKDTHSITLGTYEDDDQEEGEFFQADFDGNAIVTIYNAVHDENGWIIPYRDDEGEVNAVYEDAEAVKTITVPVTDGSGTISFESLPLGEYVYVITLDDETYDCLADGIVCVDPKKGTYTDLQSLINRAIAEAEEDGRELAYLDLEYDFAYDEAYDADLIGGVVINKPIQISGNGKTISGSDLARIFYVAEDASLEIWEVTLADGSVADNGAAIYNLGDLFVHETDFVSNKVTQGTSWAPGAPAAGGAAIYSGPGSSLKVWGSGFYDNEALHGLWNSFTCGAVYVSGAENVVIGDSVFRNNAAVLGGAITLENYIVDEANVDSEDYEATISGCGFENNIAWQGGAININEKVPYLDIEYCNFNENKAVDPNSGSSSPCGGAIVAGTSQYGTKLGLYNCNFEDNSAASVGGAIALINEACELGMNECNFNDNTAAAGGAIYFYGESAEIHNSYFNGNDPEYGGALYLAAGDVSIDHTNFDENTATKGGAIFVAKDAGLDLEQCNFYKNTAGEGSAIYADYGSSLTMKECSFDENVATGNYGTVFLGSDNAVIDQTNFNNNKGGNGGAIFWTGDNGKVTNSNFWRNEATEGFSGGAIFAFGDNIEINNCDFNENTAAVHGGAIAWINQGAIGGHEGTIINSRVNNNKAGNSGGAIYWAGESGTVDGCEFYNNEATANGAAIISTGSDMTIKDSRFDSNKAATDGAIYFVGNDADLIGDSFTNGQATMGAIVLDGASISVDKCFFEGNNGMPVHYNILNSGTIESITDTTFRFINPTIELGDSYTYGDEIKMTGTFDWGVQQPAITMKFTINGNEMETTVLDGKYSFTIDTQPDPGIYTVVIKSFTDANGNTYIVNTAEHTFVVEKATPILEVEGDEYLMPGATATVGITLTGVDMEGIAGTVIVTVDGKKYVVVTDANGEGSVDIAGLANGKYPITAEFIGNDNYGTVTNDTEFIDFYYRTATFDIVIDDYTYGDVITIIVENATDADGNPLNGMVFGNIEGAKGDGAGLAVRVENGAGTATIRKLIVDEYNVVATFTDETYEFISETKEFTFNVVKAQSAADVTYADGEFTITLDGVAGEKLNESVSVLIDGVAYDAQTTVNGTITFAAPDLAVGKHTIEVAFAGNDNYLGSVDSFTFDIPKGIPTITVTGDSIDEGETATVTVTVKDGTTGVAGNAVVTVNGVDYAVTIAENGVGTVDIDGLPYGEYPIAAKFLGNDDYEAAVYDGTAKVVVESDVATFDIVIENITYGEGLVVIVENATDAAGNPLNGRVIGNIENATGQGAGLIVYVTNGKGSRTYTGLTAGDYDVVATFYDDDYEWFSKTKEFTVNVAQAEPTVGVTYADGAITITLDGVNGEKLNETVTVAIDGTPIDIAAVTENGTFTFTPSAAPGAHLVEVEFAGNHNYVAGSAYTSFEAPKLTPTITVTGSVVDFEEAATVNVTVMDGETPVAGNAVVTVNGVNYAVTIGADGKGFVDIENLPFGEFPITAKFLANDKYEAAVYSGDAKVVVNMPTDVTFDLAVDDGLTTVTVSDATNAAGEAIDGHIMGVLMKDGQKVATLDMGTLADGTGTLALPADLDAGDYTVMVTVKDGDMKLTGTDEINFTVEPKAAVVIGDAADYAFDQTGKLEINVTDVAETPIAGNVTVVIDEGPYATVEINGNTVIDLTGFDIGAHIVNVIFTNPNYRDAEWVGGFNVTKVTPTITVTGDVVDFEEVATVNVTVMAGETPVAGNAVVTVNGVNYAVEIGADGKGTLSIADLASGSYDVAAKFLANDNYEAADYTGDAKVIVKASEDLTIEVTANEPTVGEDAVIKVTATDGEGKPVAVDKVNVTVNGETAEYDVADDGTVTIPADKLSVGDNAITVAIGDATKDATVTVAPKDTASVTVGTNAENITIEAKDGTTPLAGTASVSIDGATPSIVTVGEDGKANVPLGDLAPGKHTVEVTFINDNYEPVTEVATIIVPKATPTITVTGSEVDFGQDATVTVTVKDGETPVAGNAVVTVNGVNYAVEIGAEGTGTLTIAGLATNEYPITAKFLANDKYEEAVYSGDAKVVVGPSKDLTLEVTANEPTVGEDAVIKVTATDGEGNPVTVDTVLVTIGDGEPEEYPVAADGTVTIPADKLAAGDNAITVTVDDGQHNLATKDITVVVSAPAVLGTNITVTVTNITYGESAVIKFTLTDENGKPLNGKLNVTVEDIVKEVPIVDGEGTLALPSLSADTYPVVANFVGNDTYAPSTGTAYFNVAKNATKIIYSDMTTIAVDYPNDGRVGEYFVWRLVDANGNAIANAKMQIGFNGVVYDATTNESGYCHLQINLRNAGLFTFAISFLGDENHNASFAVARIDVKHQKPTLTVPNKSYKASAKTKTLTATFKSNKGTLIANKKVTFTVNGKTYSAKTNDKGVASVNVTITKAGTYTVTAKYAGDITYAAINKTATLKIT